MMKIVNCLIAAAYLILGLLLYALMISRGEAMTLDQQNIQMRSELEEVYRTLGKNVDSAYICRRRQ